MLSFEGEKRVAVVDGGFAYGALTRAETVEGFLEEENIKLGKKEEIYPGLETEISPGLRIKIIRKYRVGIAVDGEVKSAELEKMKIKEALERMGVPLSPLDEVKPAKERLIAEGMEIEVTRVEEEEITETHPVEFETIVEEDGEMKWGRREVEQEGEKGEREVDYLLRYENGELISKKKLSSKLAKKPVNKVIVKGTKIEVGDIQRGLASWYAHTNDMTCASVKFPRGTWLRVRNQENGKEIIVQVDDYGPSPETGKIIDLEKTAFQKIADPWRGVAEVKVEEIL